MAECEFCNAFAELDVLYDQTYSAMPGIELEMPLEMAAGNRLFFGARSL